MKEMVLKRMALKARDKKGFTLVEVIVVLVILAILMAIAVPSLTGYIDKAQRDAAVAEAVSARTAVQAIISDAHAHSGTYTLGTGATVKLTSAPTSGNPTPSSLTWTASSDPNLLAAARELSGGAYTGISGIITGDGTANSPLNQIMGLTVTTAGGTATFANNAWTFVPTPA
jgi:prepilin-type N-terminal cleavage/methylation domain-containing protein